MSVNTADKKKDSDGAQGGVSCAPMENTPVVRTIEELKDFLDQVHIRVCLLAPFHETKNYPLVEARELLPSFESDPFEHANLPGYSLVAFERKLNYFQEVFQFDVLHPASAPKRGETEPVPPTAAKLTQNMQAMLNRLAKQDHQDFRACFGNKDITNFEYYEALMQHMLHMDRAHVLGHNGVGAFALCGVYASFPSDLDSEIKRFGLRIRKFKLGNNRMYERNRAFVYQFLMEQHGFPIVSERRTSSALFARRLFKMGEKFLIRVQGQSDRTITTLYSDPTLRFYPRVEKIALVKVEAEQKDVIQKLSEGGFFVDRRKRAVILRVRYKQHKFNPTNVQEDRALSVESQEVIHPETFATMPMNVIKDSYNMFLRLNDIVQGEYSGTIVFKRHEIVEDTSTDENRLKFLYHWLTKHQRRIIGYSDDFFAKIALVLDNYLLNAQNYESFQETYELFQEVWEKYSYIQQARKVKLLEDIARRNIKGRKLGYLELLLEASALLHDLKFEIVNYFDELVVNVIHLGEHILQNPYIRKNYIAKPDAELTQYGLDVKQHYEKLAALLDEFKSIRKSRKEKVKQSPKIAN